VKVTKKILSKKTPRRMVYSLHVVSSKEDKESVVLAYYFKGSTGNPREDIFEEKLSRATRPYWRKVSTPISLVVAQRCVIIHDCGADGTVLLSGDDDEDELSLQSALPALERILAAVCEQDINRLETRQILAFHGKVVLCLNEAFPLGYRRLTNAEAVIKAAKLKAFS
jgi:hypothetical protein